MFFAQVGVIDISSRLVLSTVGNYPGVTEVGRRIIEMKSTTDLRPNKLLLHSNETHIIQQPSFQLLLTSTAELIQSDFVVARGNTSVKVNLRQSHQWQGATPQTISFFWQRETHTHRQMATVKSTSYTLNSKMH